MQDNKLTLTEKRRAAIMEVLPLLPLEDCHKVDDQAYVMMVEVEGETFPVEIKLGTKDTKGTKNRPGWTLEGALADYALKLETREQREAEKAQKRAEKRAEKET